VLRYVILRSGQTSHDETRPAPVLAHKNGLFQLFSPVSRLAVMKFDAVHN
jgi:hypothetical protein